MSDYDYLQAFIRSTQPLTVCAETKGLPAAQQACTDIPAQPKGAMVAIALENLKQRESCEPVEMAGIDTFSFTARQPGRAEIEVRSLSLLKNDAAAPVAAPRCAGQTDPLPAGLRCSVTTPSSGSLNLVALLALVASAVLGRRLRVRGPRN
jgi:hypothetical protein